MGIRMQLIRCKKCGRTYSFHPESGRFRCPYCLTANYPGELGTEAKMTDNLAQKISEALRRK